MKKLLQLLLMLIAFGALCGCATSSYQTRLDPPDAFNPVFYRYEKLQGNKVIVLAVDPGGHWAFGYDHSCDTIEEAAKNAAIKCDQARKKHKVFNKAKLFAVNNDVVYYEDQFK